MHLSGRLPKTDPIFEALGTNDELSSHLGLAQCYLQEGTDIHSQLIKIQSTLQDLNSHVATPTNQIGFEGETVKELETWIDAMDEKLPPLTRFILPSGGLAASQLHVARTVCRRAERRLLTIIPDRPSIDPMVGVYLNRLSDYLFTAARYACHLTGHRENYKD